MFASARVEEHCRRRPQDREALEELAVSRVVCRHVRLDQIEPIHRRGDGRVGEGIALHLLAGDAPVGVEVEQKRASARLGTRERRVERGTCRHALEPGRRRVARARSVARARHRESLERAERRLCTAPGADEEEHAVDPEREPEPLPEPLNWGRDKSAAEAEQEHDRERDRERRPEREGERGGRDALEQPDRDGQEPHTEPRLDHACPRPRSRDQPPGRGPDDEERRPHAEPQDEQRQPAEREIARGGDVAEHADQGGGDARADDQRRERAHEPDPGEPSAALAAAERDQALLPRAGELQLVEPEHRQRERDEQRRRRPDDRRMLEGGLHVRPARRGEQAERGVGRGHGHHVHARERERAPRAARPARADDAREDRHHRQHARGEGEQQAEAEEQRQGEEPARLERGPESILLGAVRRGGRRGRGRRAGRREHPARRHGIGARVDGFDGQSTGLRGVADAGIGAALVVELERARRLADTVRSENGNTELERVPIDHRLAVERVLVALTRRERGLPERGAVEPADGETIAVEVAAAADVDRDGNGAVVEHPGARTERLADRRNALGIVTRLGRPRPEPERLKFAAVRRPPGRGGEGDGGGALCTLRERGALGDAGGRRPGQFRRDDRRRVAACGIGVGQERRRAEPERDGQHAEDRVSTQHVRPPEAARPARTEERRQRPRPAPADHLKSRSSNGSSAASGTASSPS